jgi:tRNA/rRNA methyltransferase
MGVHRDCAAALAGFSLVVGATARTGRQRKAPVPPRRLMAGLVPLMRENRLAMVFGPEDRGLENEHLKLCHHTSTIPTADFSSLNLAQAVAVHAYELRCALEEHLGAQRPFREQKLANTFELEGMYEHLEKVLRRIDFLKDHEGRDTYWMNSIRAGFSRLGLSSREVRIVRGFCRQFLWYDEGKLKGRKTEP